MLALPLVVEFLLLFDELDFLLQHVNFVLVILVLLLVEDLVLFDDVLDMQIVLLDLINRDVEAFVTIELCVLDFTIDDI